MGIATTAEMSKKKAIEMVINVHKPENENTIVVVVETSSKVGYIFPFTATCMDFHSTRHLRL